jgi:large conductance mechanosensitive channel
MKLHSQAGLAGARVMATEFRAFLLKQNVVALAVGVIVGAAVGRVVSGLVEDVVMPLIGVLLPGGEWRQAQLALSGSNAIKYGDLLGRLLDFSIVSAVVFAILKAFVHEARPPPTRTCPECLEPVPLAARRCRACASALSGATAPGGA